MSSTRLWWAHAIVGSLHLAQSATVATLLETGANGLEPVWPLQQIGWEGEVIKTDRYALGGLVPVFPAMSAMNHFAMAFVPGLLDQTIKDEIAPIRWSEYAVSAGVMLWIVAQLAGITNVTTLVSILVQNAVLQFMGLYIEQRLKDNAPKSEIWYLMTLAFSLHISIWVPIITTFNLVVSKSDVKPPAVVYSIIWVLFGLFTTFGLVQVFHVLGYFSSYESVDFTYVMLSLVAKSLLTWMTFGGIFGAGSQYEVESTPLGN